MDSAKLLEKTKKQLRSVLISEKGGVAADRLERDYRDLVNITDGRNKWIGPVLLRTISRWVKVFLSELWDFPTSRLSLQASRMSVLSSGVVLISL